MVAFLGYPSSSIRIMCPWNLSRFQRSMSLIELGPRRNRRSVVGMRFFKDTPQIHLIIPLSAVTNSRTSSVTNGQVSLPYKSTFLTHMLKTFPLSFIRIAQLVKIDNNTQCFPGGGNKFRDHVRTTTALTNRITKIFEGGLNMLTSLKDAIAAGTISPEHLRRTKFVLSVR